MNAQEALGPWLKRYWGLEIVMSDSHTVQLSDAANPPNQWIAVSERLPAVGEQVLLWGWRCGETGPVVGIVVNDAAGFKPMCAMHPSPHDDEYDKAEVYDVTHWMALPPAPSASDSSENEATK